MRALLVALVLTATTLPVQAQSLAAKLDASRLAAQAEMALAQDEELRPFTFRPSVRDGVLTLSGRVDTAVQRDRAGTLAGNIPGVTSVVNSVAVGGTAAVDLSDLPAAPVDTARVDREETEPEPAPEPEKVYHTVRRGDTLGAIARRYGVSVRQVQRLNGLRGTTIRGGQRLRVK